MPLFLHFNTKLYRPLSCLAVLLAALFAGCGSNERSSQALRRHALDACKTACEQWHECPGVDLDLDVCIQSVCEDDAKRWARDVEVCLRRIETYYTCMNENLCASEVPEEVCVDELSAWMEVCSVEDESESGE